MSRELSVKLAENSLDHNEPYESSPPCMMRMVRAALAEDRAVSGAGSEHGGPEARDRLAASVGRAGRLSGSVTPRPRAPWGAKSCNFQLAIHQQ